MSIKTIEDLQVQLRDYFKSNLNNYISAINAEYGDAYAIETIDENNFILGEEIRGRQTRKVQFNITRGDIIVTTKGEYLIKQECDFLIVTLFYDSMTELDYRKGLRYEEAVKRCAKGIAEKFEELSDCRITRTLNNPVSPDGTTGLRMSGVNLNCSFS